jgi:ribosomal protein L11 methyltransferase
MKCFPALEIRFTPGTETAVDLRDRLVAGLDDFSPTAIEESALAWRVFFDSPASRGDALRWLRGLADPRATAQSLDVEDDDWARRSQAELQAVRIGRIVVTPPWCEDQARRDAHADDLILVVLPSTGFGTGHHESTRLCLALLERIAVGGRSVLDVGTGSGVLALAAARLGARSVMAVDNDADAIAAARENLALNQVDVPIRLECADFRTLEPARMDILLGNLTGELLRRAATDLVGRVQAGGDAIVSGVLAEEETGVVAAFEGAGANVLTTLREDEWVGLHFVNRL